MAKTAANRRAPMGNPSSLLPLGGRAFRVARATRAQREALEQHARDRTPEPLAELRARALTVDPTEGDLYRQVVRDHIAAALKRQDDWPPRFGSMPFRAFYASDEQAHHFMGVILRGDNDVTPEEVERICAEAAEADPKSYDLDFVNVTRRFLYGVDTPLTRADVKRMDGLEREAEAEAIAGSIGALKNAAARLEASGAVPAGQATGSASTTTSGGSSPATSPAPSAGRRA